MTEDRLKRLGQLLGKCWVQKFRETAPKKQRLSAALGLLSLSNKLFSESCYGWDWWFSDRDDDAYTTAERLFFVIEPDQHGHREAADSFWRRLGEDGSATDGSIVQGFAEGVLGFAELTIATA